MKLATFLRLGRVSNLPTVWANVTAGIVLADGGITAGPLLGLGLVASLLYTGGMILNDAFDADVDRRERPERPIPRGETTTAVAFAWGYGMLAAAATGMLLAACGRLVPFAAAGLTAAIAALIVAYDRWHQGNPIAPFMMGTCRAALYLLPVLASASAVHGAILGRAALVLAYVVGITYVARSETSERLSTRWPLLLLFAPLAGFGLGEARLSALALLVASGFLVWTSAAVQKIRERGSARIQEGVMRLIAGIALVDATLIAPLDPVGTFIALAAFGCTVALHRTVAGT